MGVASAATILSMPGARKSPRHTDSRGIHLAWQILGTALWVHEDHIGVAFGVVEIKAGNDETATIGQDTGEKIELPYVQS